MKALLSILAFFILSSTAFSQFTPAPEKITDNFQKYGINNQQLFKKAPSNPTKCGGDTLQYGRYKASTLQGLNVLKGYALGQYFDAPGAVTISGFDFFAWQSSRTKDSVTIVCRLYEAGKDTIPVGNPIRQTTIKVDSTFGSGQLSTLLKRVSFTPYTTTKPFIITVESDDTINRVAVVLSNWTARDGEQEWLGCGTVSGVWYNFRNLNVGGNPLDCDVMLEPHVSFSHYADFSFKNCYNYFDSVKFINKSSPFTFNVMYNRYAYFGLTYYCQRWNYGDNPFYYYQIDGGTKYTTPQNQDITLISSIFAYSNGNRCDDTVKYRLNYQPAKVAIYGNTSLCSGDSLDITALGNAPMNWYRKDTDTIAFQINPRYVSPPLKSNDTVFVKSINEKCVSLKTRIIGEVQETPDDPLVQDDSICLNSSANLIATTNVGNVEWFTDSMGITPFYTGSVYKTSNLNSDTILYVQSRNFNCVSHKRVPVTAFVSADFAPEAPVTTTDTFVCLLNGVLTLKANSNKGDTIRWYNVPSGGKPVQIQGDYQFTPAKEGSSYVYVDAFDGRCPSSRIPLHINVMHFPKISYQDKNEICQGDTATLVVSALKGSVKWYLNKADAVEIYDGLTLKNEETTKSHIFYAEPYDGACADTQRYAIELVVNPYGNITTKTNVNSCRERSLTLNATTDAGTILWYDSEILDNELAGGNTFLIPNVDKDYAFWVVSNNKGCISKPTKISVSSIAKTDATFDYQILGWRNVQFLARKGGQGTYKWDFDDKGNTKTGENISYIFTSDGNFNVRLIVENGSGCHDTTYRLITLNTVSATHSRLQMVNLFPNPFSNYLTLKLNGGELITDFAITDISGRSISVPFTTSNNTLVFDTQEIKPGIYFATVKLGTNIKTIKLIKSE